MRLLFVLLVFTFTSCGPDRPVKADLSESEKDSLKTAGMKPAVAAAPSTPSLSITPLEVSGNPGQITFTDEKGETLFYYDSSAEEGKINLNKIEYVLNQFSGGSGEGSYLLAGAGISIKIPECLFEENEGTDCFYGSCREVIVTVGPEKLILAKVAVQDCPDY